MSRIIKVTVNEGDHNTLKTAANRAHGGDVAGYVRTAALEKATAPAAIAISGVGLTREDVERIMATLNGAPDRGAA
jgi:hypothetical protein